MNKILKRVVELQQLAEAMARRGNNPFLASDANGEEFTEFALQINAIALAIAADIAA